MGSGLKDAVPRRQRTPAGEREQDVFAVALSHSNPRRQLRNVGDDIGRHAVPKARRLCDVHAVNDEFEHASSQVFAERDADRTDRDNAIGPAGPDELERSAQRRFEVGPGVFGESITRLDAARRNGVVVGVHVEYLCVVGFGVRGGDLGRGIRRQVLFHCQNGAGRVPDQAADVPHPECGFVPLRGPDFRDEIKKRVSSDFEVGRACHESIVALERWQDMRMTARRPVPQTLEGEYVRLEPMTLQALPELHAAIGHPEVYAQGYGGGPKGYLADVDDFVEWGKVHFQWSAGNPFIVRARGGELDGVVLGASTLGDFDERREHAHIGWTGFDPRVWGTQVNPEAKLLMLGLAFDSGFGRVKIQTDILNERSRAAILGVGAQFEGIIRRDVIRADGTWRDTAIYSVLIDEWPGVRAGLQARLKAWGGAPVRYRDRSSGPK